MDVTTVGAVLANFGVTEDVLGEVAATGDQRGLRLSTYGQATLAEQVGCVQQVWQENRCHAHHF